MVQERETHWKFAQELKSCHCHLNIYSHIHTYTEKAAEMEGYDPEFPVLEGLGSDIFLKPLPHVIKALAGDGDASGRELLLTHTAQQRT